MSFYARYTVWSGDFAWGDRYVSTTVELASLLAVPLLLRHRQQLGKALWITGLALLAIATFIQLVSLAFWLPLEIYQIETLGHPTFIILLRVKNIVAFALGKMDAWGLNNHAMTEDPWDYVHITTWNFLPFVLRRVGVAPAWVVHIAFAVWTAGLAALAATLWQIRSVLRSLHRLRAVRQLSSRVRVQVNCHVRMCTEKSRWARRRNRVMNRGPDYLRLSWPRHRGNQFWYTEHSRDR